MNLGFHISIAGGFKNVIPRALERNCTTMQIFSRNPRRWNFKSLDTCDIEEFKIAVQKTKVAPIFVHMPYIVNLASSDDNLYKRSVDSLITELKRSDQLGAQYVIIHAGSSKDTITGIQRMAQGIKQALGEVNNRIVLLVENTPGRGKEFGFTFRQINDILRNSECHKRIGMVFDTAHAHAAGYDLHTKKGVHVVLEELNSVVGLEKVHLVHLNDSKTQCGSRYDRHENLGKGTIGRGIGYIVRYPLLRLTPFIMETPRMTVGDDLQNLKTVKKLLKDKKHQ